MGGELFSPFEVENMQFEINGILWTLLFVDPNSPYLEMWDRYTIGVTDRSTLTIYIADNLYGEMLYRVLSHEICHAMVMSYGYDMRVPEEECMCQVMENHSGEVIGLADMLYSQIK